MAIMRRTYVIGVLNPIVRIFPRYLAVKDLLCSLQSGPGQHAHREGSR